MQTLSRLKKMKLFNALIKVAIGIIAVFLGLITLPLINGWITFPQIPSLFVMEGTTSKGEYAIVSIMTSMFAYWGLVTASDGYLEWMEITRPYLDDTEPRQKETIFGSPERSQTETL